MSAAIAIPTTSSRRHSPLLGSILAAATPWRSLAGPFATASSEEYLSECPAIAILYEYAAAATPLSAWLPRMRLAPQPLGCQPPGVRGDQLVDRVRAPGPGRVRLDRRRGI